MESLEGRSHAGDTSCYERYKLYTCREIEDRFISYCETITFLSNESNSIMQNNRVSETQYMPMVKCKQRCRDAWQNPTAIEQFETKFSQLRHFHTRSYGKTPFEMLNPSVIICIILFPSMAQDEEWHCVYQSAPDVYLSMPYKEKHRVYLTHTYAWCCRTRNLLER